MGGSHFFGILNCSIISFRRSLKPSIVNLPSIFTATLYIPSPPTKSCLLKKPHSSTPDEDGSADSSRISSADGVTRSSTLKLHFNSDSKRTANSPIFFYQINK